MRKWHFCLIASLELAFSLGHAHSLAAFTLSIPSSEEIYRMASPYLEGKGETVHRTFKRLGDRTIEMQIFLSTDAELKSAKAILSNFVDYRNWALANINRRPSGGEFYLKIMSLDPKPEDKSVLLASLNFDLPLFKQHFLYPLKLHAEELEKQLVLTVESLPGDHGPVKSVEAFFCVLPSKSQKSWLWAYMKGKAVLSNWLLYEALPEKVLQKEATVRLETLLDNYHRKEDASRTISFKTSDQ